MAKPTIDSTRMMGELEALSRLGRTASGGVTRLGLTGEEAAAKELVAHWMASGAGHDAMVFAPQVETGMLFVRSRDGVSHSPLEWTEEADIIVATEVLWRATMSLASAGGQPPSQVK